MKILYISQYFYPEVGATTNRALANVRYLSGKGHEITVLTEVPNHPQGVIRDGYRGKIFMSEKLEDFLVKRVWVFTSQKKTFYTRIFFYLSFALLSTFYALFNARKVDWIYITSPPLFVSIPGLIVKIFYPNKKLVFEIRDLWPDSAIDMGELNNRTFIKLSYWLEKKIYRKATLLIPVTKSSKDSIIGKGIDKEKIEVIYNGIESAMMERVADERIDLIENKRREGYFVVIYAGILGLAQNLKTILETAKSTQKEKILYIMAGTGPKELELHNLASEWTLDNLIFTGEIPRNKIHNYLLAADCGIIPLMRIPAFRGTLPSKVFEYMALGLPILLGVEGEAEEILNESGGGIPFIPEDANDLREKIFYLRQNPDLLSEMGDKGKEYVAKYFLREKQAEQIEKILIQNS